LFKGNTGCFQLFLHVADVSKLWQWLAALIPPGIEGEHVLLKQALKEADDGLSIFLARANGVLLGRSSLKSPAFRKTPWWHEGLSRKD
jgi:hypothetical protein